MGGGGGGGGEEGILFFIFPDYTEIGDEWLKLYSFLQTTCIW